MSIPPTNRATGLPVAQRGRAAKAPDKPLKILRTYCRGKTYSFSPELGRALLQERGQPLSHVLRGREQPEMVGLEQQTLLERHLQPLVHGFQGEAHCQGAHREYTPQGFFRRGQQLRPRHHLVHEADPVRFVGVDHVARQNEVQGVGLVGPGDGDARDGVADLEEEGVVAHPTKATCGVRSAECGVSREGRSAIRPFIDTPHPALRIRNYRTNRLPDPLFPSLAAVTSDDPDRSARITTDSPATASTRATVESLTDQATGRPERMFPPASRSVAKQPAVSPAAAEARSGVSETVATGPVGRAGGEER